MTAVLCVNRLSLCIEGVSLLSNISFNLQKGETLALIGPNGAGKSTLLKALIGMYPGVQGEVELLGAGLMTLSRREIATRVSYLPQSFNPVFDMSVSHFMELASFAHDTHRWTIFYDTSEAKRAGAQALTECGLSGFENRMLSSLSGGERQLVLIAAALCQGASVLLFDEPATYLDPSYAERVFEVINNLKARHDCSIIFATHDINSALINAKRIVAIKQGELFFDGEADQIIAQGVLDSLYEKRFTVVRHPKLGCELVLA